VVAVVAQNEIFSGLKSYGNCGIAGVFHKREAIGGRLGNPIDIEDSLCDLYRISRQGHDPFDDIASQRLVADDNDIVIVQTVWQTEFLKEDRLPGGVGRFHGRTVYKIQLYHEMGYQITDTADKQYKKQIRTGAMIHRGSFPVC
jgi:hypothetical protein